VVATIAIFIFYFLIVFLLAVQGTNNNLNADSFEILICLIDTRRYGNNTCLAAVLLTRVKVFAMSVPKREVNFKKL
jgi:hypothetical protein